MTRFAKHKKAKKPIGEDATPWEELKAKELTDKEKRQEEKREEKKRKRQLKKVCIFCLLIIKSKRKFFVFIDLFSMSYTRTFNE